MENLVVASFSDINNALTGWSKFKRLGSGSDVVVYKAVLFQIEADGGAAIMAHDDSEGGLQAVKESSIASLTGTFGGPVGLALGITVGVTPVVMEDFYEYNIEDDFVEDVKQNAVPQSYLIVAHVEEAYDGTMREFLELYSAKVASTSIEETYDRYLQQSLGEELSQMDQVEGKLNEATDETKEKLKNSLAELREKIELKKKTLKPRWEKYKKEQEVKLGKIDSRIASAKDRDAEKLGRLKSRFAKSWEKTKQKVNEILD